MRLRYDLARGTHVRGWPEGECALAMRRTGGSLGVFLGNFAASGGAVIDRAVGGVL
jgi:hypothetical protein